MYMHLSVLYTYLLIKYLFFTVGVSLLSDESEELCVKEPTQAINWIYVAVGAIASAVLLCCVCVCLCRRLCRCCCDDD